MCWGLFGGFAVEGLDCYAVLRTCGDWPWRVKLEWESGPLGYGTAEVIRLSIGGGLALASAQSGQVTTAIGAAAVGVATPIIVERLLKGVPLEPPPSEMPSQGDPLTSD